MTDSTWLALAVAVAGGAGGFGGSALSTWMSHRSQARAQHHEQQRRDAEVVGPVLEYLVDADPKRLVMNAPSNHEQRTAVLTSLEQRRDNLRAALHVLAAGHPDSVVRGLARDLAVAVYNSFSSAAWAVRDLDVQNDRSALDVAVGDHAAARALAEQVLLESARYGERG